MDTDPNADDELVVACTLSPEQATEQLGAWAALVDDAHRVVRSDGHLEIVLPLTHRARAEDLAARERACCSFLTIAVLADPVARTVTVTVDSPAPAADEVVSFIGRRP